MAKKPCFKAYREDNRLHRAWRDVNEETACMVFFSDMGNIQTLLWEVESHRSSCPPAEIVEVPIPFERRSFVQHMEGTLHKSSEVIFSHVIGLTYPLLNLLRR